MNGHPPLRVERSTQTLRERTLETLRGAIISQRFKPGDRLIERDLCDQLAVSRTVVREVLRHLEAEGIVENLPNRGPAVASPTLDEVRQIYELRGQLEGLAARGCAEAGSPEAVARLEDALRAIRAGYAANSSPAVLEATTQFYRALFEGAGRGIAWTIVSSLHARINYLRAITTATPGRHRDGPKQMKAIVDAVRKGDGAAAEAACRTHIGRAYDLAVAALLALDDPAGAADQAVA